ncbi:ABC transporter B family member 15-like isoform X2 [Punica granatum]|nr:ABC transporter B family member 15-like isoform X2 [Punica granatum]
MEHEGNKTGEFEINEKKKKNEKKTGSLRSLFMHADGVDKCLMTVGLIGAVADGFATPAVFFVTSHLMNDIGTLSTSDLKLFRDKINKNSLILLWVASALLLLTFLEGYCWTRTAERQAARMRVRYLQAMLRQDVSYFDLHATSTSEAITSVSSDSLVIQDVFGEKVPNFLMNVSLFIGSYIAAFALLWRLAIVGLPFVPLLIIPGMVYSRTLMGIARKIRKEYDVASTIAEQAVSSIRTVYAFVGETKTMTEFSIALQGSVKLGLKQGLAKGLVVGSNSITFAIWAFMAYYGSRMVMYHGAKGGTVYAAGTSITFGGVALRSALSNLKDFSEACIAGERILEMTERVPTIDPSNEEGEILHNVTGKVEFNQVKFSYPSRRESTIFKDFCLTIPAGKKVALVGGSGSGKSTVVSLLLRFYDPLGGEILLDRVPINTLQIKWLRSQMGLVSQEPTLFATSIKENILFGKEDATIQEVMEAARASNAHDFISQLPQGYDTEVGERGVQISGGQKQRIAIARAIIKSPRILLLDEATSALDSESEQVVQEALDKASIGCTTLVIAHRLSTIRNADLIAVVQSGQVVEVGPHKELIQNPNGNYTALINLQEMEKEETIDKNKSVAITYNSSSILPVDHLNSTSSSTRSIRAAQSSLTPEDSFEDKKFPVPSFRRIIALNIPEWKQATLGCFSAILFGGVQPVCSFTIGSMISVYFLSDHDQMKEKIRIYCLCFLGLAIFSFFISISQHYNFAYMGEHLTKRIRERMLSKILTFEVGWFDQEENSSGAVCSRLAKDAAVVRSLVGDRMALLVQTCSAITIAFTMGLIIAWKLAIVMIAAQPLIIVCFYGQKVLLQKLIRKALKAQDESSKLVAEAVSNHRTITAFSSQDRILSIFDKAQEGPRRESIRQSWYAGLGLGTAQFFIRCMWTFNLWYGAKLISQGYIAPKELFETFMILIRTGNVIADAGSMTSDIARGSETVATVFAILDRQTRIEPNDLEGYQPENIRGEIEFCKVDFAYPARPSVLILKDFSFKIEDGKSTALVGQSGSGKSTLIGLMERFYDPSKGIVKLDNRDIQSYHLRSLRKYIALVSQEPTLFAGTIRENIAYGMSDNITETEIIEAAKAAYAHEYIVALKDGYDTWCGDRGVQLSGGQKQRVAIARAILKNPSLLLLDEATSALDSQSERIVQNALERLMKGRTSVVVAHRLSTIYNCDLIAVLDKGNVVEKGCHSSLLAKGPTGAYYSLVNLQNAHNSGHKLK